MYNKKILFITHAAIIAALYVVLTYVANAFGLASGSIQIRLSEALTILPFFTPAAIPGLFIGCLLSNILTGGVILDIIFGSLATLIGALLSYKLRGNKYLVPIPPILANAIIVPFILIYGYGLHSSTFSFLMLTVGIGEIISCGILGLLLLKALYKYKNMLFSTNN